MFVDIKRARGVAMPRAQGQEITSTDTAFMRELSIFPLIYIQPKKVRKATAMTEGHKN